MEDEEIGDGMMLPYLSIYSASGETVHVQPRSCSAGGYALNCVYQMDLVSDEPPVRTRARGQNR